MLVLSACPLSTETTGTPFQTFDLVSVPVSWREDRLRQCFHPTIQVKARGAIVPSA